MICENCSNPHTKTYGSGRFCDVTCARGFSTKKKRKEINEKVSRSLKGRQGISVPYTEETRKKVKETWIQKLFDINFNDLSFGSKRKVVLYEQENKCSKCSISEWFGQQIPLEVDHINGISNDDRRENLEALCPNCHSITPTWRGRNKPARNGNNKVTDEEMLEALGSTTSIRQALLSLGLAAKGGNYTRAKRLLDEKIKR
jgi:5-methylcytosine-specific restriction endonuclease McrA